ncbi:hypothetical protein BJX70DRAFT_373874 [Aspergillus crustosus]
MNPAAVSTDTKETGILHITRDQLLHALPDLFDNTSATERFCATRPDDTAHNPGLEIRGVGSIALPLSSDAAAAIANVSRRTPLPERLKNGTSVGTWELDAKDITTRNPKWAVQLDRFVREAKTSLHLTTTSADV